MTPWGRAILGAAIGAVLTLFLHPASRPYLTEAILHPAPLSAPPLTVSEALSLPPPTDPISAGAWLQEGAEKLHHGLHLSPKEIQTLLALEREADQAQPDNAFWPQMEAVLLDIANRPQEAQAAWVRASNRTIWNDEQTPRLLSLRQHIANRLGWNEGWTFGYVFFGRSEAAAAEIQRYAAKLVKQTALDDRPGLELRYATIRNGSLLRDGSRSIRVGLHGYDMVERASYPSSLSGAANARRIWIAETTMTARLRQEGMTDESRKAFDAFNNNDAWRALTGAELPDAEDSALSATREQSPDDNVRSLCLVAVCLAGLPGAMALAALCGFALMALGSFLQPKLSSIRFFTTTATVAAALLMGYVVFLITRLWLAGTSVAVTVAFLTIGPSNPRKRKNDDMGPLFSLLLSMLSLVILGAFDIFILGVSTAARSLAPMLGPLGEYIGNAPMFLGVACIELSLICVVATLYAIVRRFGTPDVLALSLRKIGQLGGSIALLACVLGWPLTVFADHLCGNELKELVENEPIYYLVTP